MSADSTDTELFSATYPVPAGWGTDRIPDLTGKVAVVTGANNGIGLATALELAKAGAALVLAVRNTGRGNAAAAEISAAAPGALLEVRRLDLADLGSVRDFADRFLDEHAALDLLINNAGLMATPRRLTADGYELQFGTNHLGHFALTGLLLPALAASSAARVVTVSSDLHARGRLDFTDLQGRRHYGRLRAYSNSKLANLLFTAEFDRRASAAGLPVHGYGVHPGLVATSLITTGRSRPVRTLMAVPNRLIAVSPATGALPTLCAATLPGLPGGTYLGPGGRTGLRGTPAVLTPAPRARDTTSAIRLWEISRSLTEVSYDFTPTPTGNGRGAPRT
jgi:NAD(P)-dependent dehydrogenase (short-subunit alcohol dehydrogenase family)